MGLPARKFDKVYTYRDYASWPHDERWEIIDGVAWNMSPAPARNHQKILGDLYLIFRDYFEYKACEVYLAPFDVFFPVQDQDMYDVTTVVQPDISVICDDDKLIDQGCNGFIQKPFKINELSKKIREVIESADEAGRNQIL